MEWPPQSGRRQEFPELDRAAWFSVGEARRKILKGQAVFLDRKRRLERWERFEHQVRQPMGKCTISGSIWSAEI